MFSRIRASLYQTAAWRMALRNTLVFAAGSAAVFVLMYFVIADAVRERSDSWLIGESEVLRRVALATPRHALNDKIVEEVAELSTEELAYSVQGRHHQQNTVFFLLTGSEEDRPIWIGPQDSKDFIGAIERSNAAERAPIFLAIPGWKAPFRVVTAELGDGRGRIYLGLLDSGSTILLHKLLERFFAGWILMVGIGFVVAVLALRGMLRRVDAITTAAAKIGAGDLGSRVQTGPQNDEIARLARTLNGMLDRISASVNHLRTLTESVAHDLKSPITTVRGSLEYALSTEDEESSRELIAKAIDHLDHLSEVITTSLDVAEADAGALRLNLQAVDIADLVARVTELYAPSFAERKQRLRTELPGAVFADVDVRFFNRALSNLMENELRHAGEDALIVVSVTSDSGLACITVSDDGPGFPPQLLDRVFQRFTKGEHSGGHGLGLSLVHAVMMAHGGAVRVENVEGRGALVAIELPLNAEAASKLREERILALTAAGGGSGAN